MCSASYLLEEKCKAPSCGDSRDYDHKASVEQLVAGATPRRTSLDKLFGSCRCDRVIFVQMSQWNGVCMRNNWQTVFFEGFIRTYLPRAQAALYMICITVELLS